MTNTEFLERVLEVSGFEDSKVESLRVNTSVHYRVICTTPGDNDIIELVEMTFDKALASVIELIYNTEGLEGNIYSRFD